jgi:hypothetical protein
MIDNIYEKLKAPFSPIAVSYKINSYNHAGTKAQITFYIDARDVQSRLNDVLGLSGWSFTWIPNRDSGVHGSLTLHFGEKSVTREDVGYPNSDGKEQQDKDAVSDALKRCAVHFGIGNFLYNLPQLWIDLDSEQKSKRAAKQTGIYLTDAQNQQIRTWLTNVMKPTPQIAPQAPVRPVQPSAPTGPINTTSGPCPVCHAPTGKPHASTCATLKG